MLRRWTATIYVNVAEDMRFFLYGLSARDPIAEVDTFAFDSRTTNPEHIADLVWPVGNKDGVDHNGKEYPLDVRSLSIGDLVKVEDDTGRQWFFALEGVGHKEIPEPANPVVPIEGTRATSRKR